MIVQTRNLGERFVIGNGIVVTIVCIHGESVSLGIHYPDGTVMAAEELLGHLPESVSRIEGARYGQCDCVDLG